MEGHFCFEEDFFDKEECSKIVSSTREVVHQEKLPGWFTNTTCSVEDSEEATRLKFCGDWAYRQGHYQEALGHYTNSLGVLSYSNHIMRRGLQESLTRCHVHLQHSEDAIDGYTALRESCCNFEQTSDSLQLGAFVFHTLNLKTELLQIIQQLVILHPADATVWLQLADVYSCMVNNNRSCVEIFLKYVAALYRTRFLLEQSFKGSNSFVKKKHEENLLKVNEQIKSCDLPIDIQERIIEHMSTEPESEDHTGDDRYLLSLLAKSEEVFNSCWLPWMSDCLTSLSMMKKCRDLKQCHLNESVT